MSDPRPQPRTPSPFDLLNDNPEQLVQISCNIALHGSRDGARGNPAMRWPWNYIKAPEVLTAAILEGAEFLPADFVAVLSQTVGRAAVTGPSGDLRQRIETAFTAMTEPEQSVLVTGHHRYQGVYHLGQFIGLEEVDTPPPFVVPSADASQSNSSILEAENVLAVILASLRWLESQGFVGNEPALPNPLPLAVLARQRPELLLAPTRPADRAESKLDLDGVLRSTLVAGADTLEQCARLARFRDILAELPRLGERLQGILAAGEITLLNDPLLSELARFNEQPNVLRIPRLATLGAEIAKQLREKKAQMRPKNTATENIEVEITLATWARWKAPKQFLDMLFAAKLEGLSAQQVNSSTGKDPSYFVQNLCRTDSRPARQAIGKRLQELFNQHKDGKWRLYP